MVVHMRHTRAHTANRRSHHALEAVRLAKCAKCDAAIALHRACPKCGNYRGRTVVSAAAKVTKKIAKAKAKTKSSK